MEPSPILAAIADAPELPAQGRIVSALERSGFWRLLRERAECSRVAASDLKIVIKPDLAGFASCTITSPALVEQLIDLLHDAGYSNVALASAPDSSALWAENRDVLSSADLQGYGFVTLRGRPYEIIDLSEDLAPATFRPGQLLHGTSVARAWQEADFRIVFAKNKTDQSQTYALCLDSLLGVLPLLDKEYHYRLKVSSGEVVTELLQNIPVHFAIIDAIESAHGSGASTAPVPIVTNCIIAASDVRVADYIGALKMGLDPEASPVAAAVRTTLGMPAVYAIDGSLSVYPGWLNVNPLVVDSTRQRDASPVLSRLTKPWLQVLDPTLFPLKSAVDARINATAAPFFASLDEDPVAFAALVMCNYTLAGAARMLDWYRVLYDKDALARAEAPLKLDLDKYSADDYWRIPQELAQLALALNGVPEQAEGLRWRYVSNAVVFEYVRTLPIDFDAFVAKVDVARTIQYLTDYIGGVIVPVELDAQGRVIRQAERNLYLPQPNYIALADGKPIDVSKIEVASYEESLHQLCWKTVGSENGSAIYDDGMVTFMRNADMTTVRIFGRQLFVLPPFWQAMNLDLHPQFKAQLVTHAYKTFFDRSLANLEALVEGRDIRIGKPWYVPAGSTDHETLPIVAIEQWFQRIGDKAGQVLAQLSEPVLSSVAGQELVQIDEDGFSHFRASQHTDVVAHLPSARNELDFAVDRIVDFWSGLAKAVRRDVTARAS